MFISRLITRPGKIIDLGCGNGLLLKLILSTTAHKLIPYGVDFLKESITQAKKTVLPRYSTNFTTANVKNYVFKHRFDYILMFPDSVADEDFKAYYEKCASALARQGIMIIYIERDSISRFKERKLTLSLLKSKKMIWSTATGLFGYIKQDGISR